MFMLVSCEESSDVIDDSSNSDDTTQQDDDDEVADEDTLDTEFPDETPEYEEEEQEERPNSVSDVTAEVDEIAHVYKTVYNTTTTGEDLYIYEYSTITSRMNNPLPAIVFFHGGSWTSSSYTAFRINSQYFATQGVICFSVQYRKNNSTYDGKTASFLDCLRDAKSAIRWVRENAEELNIDPDRIVASGGSAGGHLAAAAAMCDKIYDENDNLEISPAADLLMLYNPVVHTGPSTSVSGFQSYSYSSINTACKAEGLTAEDFSPFNNVDDDVPPTIFMVGEKDTYIPPQTSIEYQRLIEAEGGECKLWFYQNQEHSFFGLTSTAAATEASGFASTATHSQEWLREKGFINDNDCQVQEWLTYKGYTNWEILSSFDYDTSISTIASDYTSWCAEE